MGLTNQGKKERPALRQIATLRSQSDGTSVTQKRSCYYRHALSSPIRTITVGSGISPDLLTPKVFRPVGARGLPRKLDYRRSGFAPCPENKRRVSTTNADHNWSTGALYESASALSNTL